MTEVVTTPPRTPVTRRTTAMLRNVPDQGTTVAV